MDFTQTIPPDTGKTETPIAPATIEKPTVTSEIKQSNGINPIPGVTDGSTPNVATLDATNPDKKQSDEGTKPVETEKKELSEPKVKEIMKKDVEMKAKAGAKPSQKVEEKKVTTKIDKRNPASKSTGKKKATEKEVKGKEGKKEEKGKGKGREKEKEKKTTEDAKQKGRTTSSKNIRKSSSSGESEDDDEESWKLIGKGSLSKEQASRERKTDDEEYEKYSKMLNQKTKRKKGK